MIENNTSGAMLVGAAKTALQFPADFFPHKSFRGRYFTGVHDDIYARALYVRDGQDAVVFISVEVGDVSDRWIAEIAEHAGVPEQNVFLMATHNHAAPHLDGTWPEDVIDVEQGKAFGELCRKSLLDVVGKAIAAARSARVRLYRGSCGINVNRDYAYSGNDGTITVPYITAPNHEGVSDKTLRVLKFEDTEGRELAYLVNYAIHSNVTFFQTWTYEDGMLVSSDLSGVAMKYVEDRSDEGAVALFSLSAAADQLPKYNSNHRVFDKDGNAGWEYYGKDAGFVLTDAQGSELGAAVLHACGKCEGEPLQGGIAVYSQQVKAMGKVDGVGAIAPAAKPDNVADSYRFNYKEQMGAGFRYTPTEELTLQLQLIRLGSLYVITVPAEIVTGIGADMMKAISEKTGAEAMVISQCNGSYSYISDERGYEIMTFAGVASHFMPGISEKLLEGVRKLLAQLPRND